MAETTRELVVRLTMDAGGFKKTADVISTQIRNIDREIKSMGDDKSGKKSKLEEKLGLQKTAVDNLKKAVDQAKTKLAEATTEKNKLLAAKELSGLETKLATAEANAKRLANELRSMNLMEFGSLATKFGGVMKKMGRSFSLYVGAPLAALGLSSMNVFKEYEMAATLLETKLDGTAEQVVEDAERLSAAALDMSETIPVAYTEIMAIMTSLAAAGVPTKKIEGMTLALAQMSAVTGMSADEVGTSMVLFMNAMNEPFENIDQLGAALVELADASIATETSIFDMATRMAATGGLAGMSAVDVFSLAAAFSSMGVNAEAGGTAASKLMKIMQVAADTGTKSEMFTDTMGLSFEEFSKQWEQFPAQTMLGFFQGLQNMDTSGQQSVLSFLDEVGLTEVRLSNLIALGARNPDMFKDLLDVGDTGFEENLALVEKSDKIFDTASGQMDVFSNKMKNSQADLGENVTSALTPVIETVGNLVSEFGKLDEATQDMWVKIGAALVALGPVASGIGGVATAVGKIATWAGKVKAGEVDNVTKLMGALKGPGGGGWLLVAAGVAGVVAAVNSLGNKTEGIQEQLRNIEFKVDEATYNETMAAMDEMRAKANLLSGEEGAKGAGMSAAVQAGYGTSGMFGQAFAYETALSQQAIAEASGKYSSFINELNDQIVAAVKAGDTAVAGKLEDKRATVQAEWDDAVATERTAYAAVVGNLFAGMIESPELKASLEQASKDYDLFSAVTNAIEQAELGEEADFAGIMTREVLGRFLGNADLRPSYANAVELKGAVAQSLAESVKSTEGESVLSALWNAIMDDPDASTMIDLTKTQGVFDGWVELMDFAKLGDSAGAAFGTTLTPGLADPIMEAIPAAQQNLRNLGEQLAVEAAAQAAAVSAAWNAGLIFNTPNPGGGTPGGRPGGGVNNTNNTININGQVGTTTGNYAVVRQVTDAVKRVNRGYGKG